MNLFELEFSSDICPEVGLLGSMATLFLSHIVLETPSHPAPVLRAGITSAGFSSPECCFHPGSCSHQAGISLPDIISKA